MRLRFLLEILRIAGIILLVSLLRRLRLLPGIGLGLLVCILLGILPVILLRGHVLHGVRPSGRHAQILLAAEENKERLGNAEQNAQYQECHIVSGVAGSIHIIESHISNNGSG